MTMPALVAFGVFFLICRRSVFNLCHSALVILNETVREPVGEGADSLGLIGMTSLIRHRPCFSELLYCGPQCPQSLNPCDRLKPVK